MNYYNEFDPYAAQWLRNLISSNLIPQGTVDERSIELVQPDDLQGFSQCHFFAGIGGWSYALRLAGWPEDREVWTGSCPCQPFSAAGKGLGEQDPRHLWPQFLRLISACKPSIVFGEQVASKGGRDWLAGVRADLETLAYEVGAADLCAAGVGAPHVRQRLWWSAYANHVGLQGGCDERQRQRIETLSQASIWRNVSPPFVCTGSDGVPARMGRLCGYGNAIVPQVAAEVIAAFMDVRP